MTLDLTEEEQAILAGETATAGAQMALRIVTASARILQARQLVPIQSAHIDGCLYHGSSGTEFAERLVTLGARVAVPSTTNVGALNLLKPSQCRLDQSARKLAYRLMVAHEQMGCKATWTCAPYQAGARPEPGAHVAWGESNAVAFCNSVLGARTNRYGDFLDIACAVSGRAPYCGLHLARNRLATHVVDVSALPVSVQESDVFCPVLGALIGRLAGGQVCAVTGLQIRPDEDQLKALCAAAAATGAVGLVHLVGVTPEASSLDIAIGGRFPLRTTRVTREDFRRSLSLLSQTSGDRVDAVALGSPHFSISECRKLFDLSAGHAFRIPVYLCTGRHVFDALKKDGTVTLLEELGVVFVVDTCVVVTPILPKGGKVLMTNSAKFAQYAQGNTGYAPVFGSLRSCVLSAQQGRVVSAVEART